MHGLGNSEVADILVDRRIFNVLLHLVFLIFIGDDTFQESNADVCLVIKRTSSLTLMLVKEDVSSCFWHQENRYDICVPNTCIF